MHIVNEVRRTETLKNTFDHSTKIKIRERGKRIPIRQIRGAGCN